MNQASAAAVRAYQGRVWHRVTRRDSLLTWNRCSASFFTFRSDTSVLAAVPPQKRCVRCWGAYMVDENAVPDDRAASQVSVGNTRPARGCS